MDFQRCHLATASSFVSVIFVYAGSVENSRTESLQPEYYKTFHELSSVVCDLER